MDKELLEKLIKGYQEELEELERIKEENSIALSQMTDEELENQLVKDLEAVKKDIEGK